MSSTLGAEKPLLASGLLGFCRDPIILTAPDRFIHAHERLDVIEEPLTPAWRRRIAFAFLFAATMDGRA